MTDGRGAAQAQQRYRERRKQRFAELETTLDSMSVQLQQLQGVQQQNQALQARPHERSQRLHNLSKRCCWPIEEKCTRQVFVAAISFMAQQVAGSQEVVRLHSMREEAVASWLPILLPCACLQEQMGELGALLRAKEAELARLHSQLAASPEGAADSPLAALDGTGEVTAAARV